MHATRRNILASLALVAIAAPFLVAAGRTARADGYTAFKMEDTAAGGAIINGSLADDGSAAFIAIRTGGAPRLTAHPPPPNGNDSVTRDVLISRGTAAPSIKSADSGTKVIFWSANASPAGETVELWSPWMLTVPYLVTATSRPGIGGLDFPVFGRGATLYGIAVLQDAAGNPFDEGIYALPGLGGPTVPLLLTADAPSGVTSLLSLSSDTTGLLTFEAIMTAGRRGIFRTSQATPTNVRTIAIEGPIETFTTVRGNSVNAAGQVAFFATHATDGNQIRRANAASGTTALAQTGAAFQSIPLQRPMIGGTGAVFFEARRSAAGGGMTGAYASDGTSTWRVVEVGDTVAGVTVADIERVIGSNASSQVVVVVTSSTGRHVAIRFDPVANTAPVLDASTPLALDPTPATGTAIVTTIADLLASRSPFAPIADTDTAAVQGIAVVAADQSHGAFEYTIDGTTFFALGSVGATVARLLGAEGIAGLRFVPSPGFTGTASITFRAWDQTSGLEGTLVDAATNGGATALSAATSTALIPVVPVNVAPSFTRGADLTALEDAGPRSIAGWASAISPGPASEAAQTVTFTALAADPSLFSAGPAVAPDGTLTFTPAADANGTTTVTVVARDDGGTAVGGADASAPQTFTIAITPVNDAPTFTKGADVTALEDAGPQTIPGWATALSRGPANESAQSLTFTAQAASPALFSAGPRVAPDGALTFTPAADASGAVAISVTLHDDGGTASGGADASATQTFTITLTPVNDAPSFTKGADVQALEDAGPRSIAGWATAISAGPANESAQEVTFEVSAATPSLFAAGPAVASDGTLTFTPAANATGATTVTLTARDDGGAASGGVDVSASQTFTITIAPVNDAPTFSSGPDVALAYGAGPQTITAWATAISPGPADEAAQALTFTAAADPSTLFDEGPSISPGGALTLTPAPGASGVATITVTLRDDGGTADGGADTSVARTFTIAIAPASGGGGSIGGGGGCASAPAGGEPASALPWVFLLAAIGAARGATRRAGR